MAKLLYHTYGLGVLLDVPTFVFEVCLRDDRNKYHQEHGSLKMR